VDELAREWWLMKVIWTFLLLAGASKAVLGQRAPVAPDLPTPPPFSLEITTGHEAFKLGDDVYLRIVMTNNSTEGVDCTAADVGPYDLKFHIVVRDENGQAVSLRHPHLERFPGSFKMCTLRPRESITREILISWQHDFSRPGKYEIQVSRGASSDWTQAPVTSNKIYITVLTADAAPVTRK
jgi:hypothetical protein